MHCSVMSNLHAAFDSPPHNGQVRIWQWHADAHHPCVGEGRVHEPSGSSVCAGGQQARGEAQPGPH